MNTLPSLLVLTSTLPRFAGDPEPRFVLDLSKNLSTNYSVTILAPADPMAADEETLEGIRVVRYRYAPLRRWEMLAYPGAILPRLKTNPLLWILVPLMCLGLYRAAARLLRKESFACIHAHWIVPQGLIAAMLRSRFKLPFVVTSHGADVFALRGRLTSALRSRVLGAAAATTVVSRAIQLQLQQEFPSGGLRTEVIPMGVDCSRFHPSRRRETLARDHGLARPMVAFVGRLTEKKGVEYLIEAFSLPALSDGPATLAIVGDGELRQSLEARVKTLGLAHRVRFFGAISHSDLPELMASSDIVCAPSIVASGGDREGLPTVLCEAAACGLPVVSTRVSGISEIVIDGKTGFLVNEKDALSLSVALRRLVGDEDLRAEISKAARQQALEFDWPRIASRFAATFSSVVHVRMGS